MGHTPFGYRIESGKAVISEDEATAVRMIFTSYLDGDALETAAEKAGIRMKHAGVRRILQNKKYLGTDFYPAIINQETFEKAAQEIKRRATYLNKKYGAREKKAPQERPQFTLGKIEKHLKDPFLQAAYVYSLIESEVKTNA